MLKPFEELAVVLSRNKNKYEVVEDWKFYVENIPVSRELYNFVQDINSKQAGLKYHPCDNKYLEFKTGERVTVAKSLYVYMDGMPFILGAVGYGDFSTSRNGDKSYMVYSRKISNDKYNSYNDQHYMTLTTDIKKAVKNASKFIIPYTNLEIASVYFPNIQNNVNSNVSNAGDGFFSIVNNIKNSTTELSEELVHLVKSGVQFKTPLFANMAKDIIDKHNTYLEYQNRVVDVTFVCFRQGNTMSITTMDVGNITKNNIHSLNFKDKATNVNTYTSETLPDEISSKVAVLNILNDDQYVENVGMKINSNTFWIERNTHA